MDVFWRDSILGYFEQYHGCYMVYVPLQVFPSSERLAQGSAIYVTMYKLFWELYRAASKLAGCS